MKEKIYMDENLFDLSVLVGNWESVYGTESEG